MTATIAVILIFGMPVFLFGISRYYKFRTAKLRLAERGLAMANPEDRKRIETLEKDRALLVERVEHLETIVTSVDLELNARLNRLAAHQSMLALPPQARPAVVASAPAGAVVGAAPAEHSASEPSEVAASSRPQGSATGATIVAQTGITGEVAAGTELLGRYRVERMIGRGGMGVVYLAADSRIGEPVAIKLVSANVLEDPSAEERFRREVGAARKITHRNVIRIHDLGEDSGRLFLSMEYFAGTSLGQLLERRGALPEEEAREIMLQVCDALAAAHQVGVIHRDLKPQNILVNERREVRVIDFGLAKASYMRTMTATGLIMGTPEYMAPEQVRGRKTDHRTDIYSLGAVTYHVLCGRPPFVADSPIAVGFLHCTEPPRPLRQLRPALPEALEETVRRCLAKDPSQRFDSMSQVRDELARG